MAIKITIICLVLSWIVAQVTSKIKIDTKFQNRQPLQYREQAEYTTEQHSCDLLECDIMRTDKDGEIKMTRTKRAAGIQYRHEKKENIEGFIPKSVARPEYGTVYQQQGMMLQNLHRRYLYIVIRLPHIKDLDTEIPEFPDCGNYGIR